MASPFQGHSNDKFHNLSIAASAPDSNNKGSHCVHHASPVFLVWACEP